ncbi:hypothetical protein GSI_07954 [Ganoderma sinense ZZ0214-1]|uniref:DUF7223 domain-containing protein n=1 Tax=Ganoderma sinense ZZ0214-1 TaxID=1077348 RepID=A0A2G8S8D1_9APHY|nr:hypothetical protein GSI_07954 [Ganoderma sinense ZZ0214-1]
MVLPVSFFVAALFPIVALAANDWTQPCHTGACEWDLPATQGSGTMRLSGSDTSISDLTSAGGWTILDCNATAADQDIRVVCHDPSQCDHVFQNGAENTVVRLPNNCSSEPFAVVTRLWNHSDQSIPASRRSLLERRGGPQRLVQGVSLSTDFAATNFSQHGNITVLVVGSSLQGVSNITQSVAGCDAPAIASKSHGCNATSVALKIFDPFSKKTKSGSFTIPPKTFQKNLFNDSFACPQSGNIPAFNGIISVDLKSTVGGDINYAITFAGLLHALDSSALSLVVGFDASVDGALSLTADLTGSFTTGDIPLFTTGIPGLDFGSILKIGPTFTINAEADASIASNLELDVPISFTLSGGKLVFPPSQGSSSAGTFTPGNAGVKLSASPNVTAKAQLAAHVKPSFEFGMTILKQTADIFLELDTFAELDLSLTATANASASASTGSNSTSTSACAGAGGCVDVQAGLAVNAGANADLLGIIKANDKVSLFSKSFDLFKKCFGNSFQRRDHRGSHSHRVPLGLSPVEQSRRKRLYGYGPSGAGVERRRIVRKSGKGFSCPTSSLGGLSSIV